MGDTMLPEPSRRDIGPLQIEAMLYQTKPLHGIDSTVRSLLREWRAFFAAFLFVMALGTVYLIVAPREYMAEAIVMAAPRQPDLSRTDTVVSLNGPPEPAMALVPDVESEIQIMTSPAALRRVVKDLKLNRVRPGEPPPGTSLTDLIQAFRVTVGLDAAHRGQSTFPEAVEGFLSRFGIHIGDTRPPPVSPERLTSLAEEHLNRNLNVGPIGRSTLVRIRYLGRDPKEAAAVATEIARNYIDTRYQDRVQAAKNASDWLSRHTKDLRSAVVDAETRLAKFRASAVVGGLDAKQLQDSIRVLNERIVAARADQQKAESRVTVAAERVRKDGPIGLLNWETGPGANEYLVQVRAIAAMRENAVKLRAVQGPFSVNVKRLEAQAAALEHQLKVEAQTRFANLKMSAEAARREVKLLEASLQKLRRSYDTVDARSVQIGALENAVAASRAVYQNFVSRWMSTEQAGFNASKDWLVSAAHPPVKPYRPSIPLVLIGSFAAAVGAGVSNALYKEYRASRTIRSSDDLERHLPGVRNLGLLPELPARYHRARDVVATIHDGSHPEFIEAARGLYASLNATTNRTEPVKRGRVVLVSSALPMEGKSTTTGVLALVAAAAGQRILVIDCDLRNPNMHDVAAVSASRGLAGCLENGLTPHEVMRKNSETGIWVMPAGKPQHTPQRLFQSRQFGDTLSMLRDTFDLILLDTPPVLGVSDARIVSRLADQAVLTICWSRTTWKAVQFALRMLTDAGTPIAGAVLTRVNVKRLAAFEVAEAEPYRGSNWQYYRDYYQSANALVPVPPTIQGPGA